MSNQVKIRCVGREQFWSAGRKWVAVGRVVTIVDDDPIPRDFKRAAIDRFGNFLLIEEQFKEGEPIPLIPARTARPYWRGDTMRVKDGDKEFEVQTELDFPLKDPEFQERAKKLRKEHDDRGEITTSDYAQICADSRFLAIESPQPPQVFAPPKPQQAKK